MKRRTQYNSSVAAKRSSSLFAATLCALSLCGGLFYELFRMLDKPSAVFTLFEEGK